MSGVILEGILPPTEAQTAAISPANQATVAVGHTTLKGVPTPPAFNSNDIELTDFSNFKHTTINMDGKEIPQKTNRIGLFLLGALAVVAVVLLIAVLAAAAIVFLPVGL